jgi:hypothetical protein
MVDEIIDGSDPYIWCWQHILNTLEKISWGDLDFNLTESVGSRKLEFQDFFDDDRVLGMLGHIFRTSNIRKIEKEISYVFEAFIKCRKKDKKSILEYYVLETDGMILIDNYFYSVLDLIIQWELSNAK